MTVERNTSPVLTVKFVETTPDSVKERNARLNLNEKWYGVFVNESVTSYWHEKNGLHPILCRLPKEIRVQLEDEGYNIPDEYFNIEVKKVQNNKGYHFDVTYAEHTQELVFMTPTDVELEARPALEVRMHIGDQTVTANVRNNDDIDELLVTVIKSCRFDDKAYQTLTNKLEKLEKMLPSYIPTLNINGRTAVKTLTQEHEFYYNTSRKTTIRSQRKVRPY